MAPLVGGTCLRQCLVIITTSGLLKKVQGSIAFYLSWRIMQLYLAAAGVFQLCWMYSYFPETAQPGTRGIDKLQGIDNPKHHPRVIFINPLRPLALLRCPNLLFIVSLLLLDVSLQAPKNFFQDSNSILFVDEFLL